LEDVVGNRRDLVFLLFEVLQVESLCTRPRYRDHDRASLQAALDLTLKIAEEIFWPNAPSGDTSEPTLIDGQVRLPRTVHQSVAAIRDVGLRSPGYVDPGFAVDLTVPGKPRHSFYTRQNLMTFAMFVWY